MAGPIPLRTVAAVVDDPVPVPVPACASCSRLRSDIRQLRADLKQLRTQVGERDAKIDRLLSALQRESHHIEQGQAATNGKKARGY